MQKRKWIAAVAAVSITLAAGAVFASDSSERISCSLKGMSADGKSEVLDSKSGEGSVNLAAGDYSSSVYVSAAGGSETLVMEIKNVASGAESSLMATPAALRASKLTQSLRSRSSARGSELEWAYVECSTAESK